MIIVSSGRALAQDSVAQKPDTTQTLIPIKKPVHRKPLAPRPQIMRLDSTQAKDSAKTGLDSVAKAIKIPVLVVATSAWRTDTFLFTKHPFFSFTNPIRIMSPVRKWQGKEASFYSIIALLIFFAFIKNGFYRYMQDLFKIFFRTSVKQRQIKDQVVQNPLASLLLNIFFLMSGGMFLALLLQSFGLGLEFNFWALFIYCMLGLIGIYGVKFITLKFFGFIFQVSEAIDTYIFIVFTTNKIIGIFLLPFVILMAFSYGLINQVALTLSILLVLSLFAYRFFLSYVSIHRQVKINFFHFFIYLCAFEIAPLLLINKLLFTFL